MKTRAERVREILREFLRLEPDVRETAEPELLREHPDLDELLRQLLPQVRTKSGVDAETTLDALLRDPTLRLGQPDATLASSSADVAPGDTLPAGAPARPTGPEAPLFDGRYRVLRTIGAGGFGRVDLVADTLHGQERLALKVILPQYSDVAEFEGRFRNEISTMRALRHEGIPQIFNDGRTAKGEFYFTMEYVEGEPLEDVLEREGSLGPQRIVRLVRQLTAVLDFAHSCGVVHRDLKPGNIILIDAGTPEEKVKVLDFGIAKILRKEGLLSHAKTMDTMGAMGTPHYMAPEQVRGQDVDERADYYALGVLIYRMVSSRYPFKGKTAMEIATARIDQDPQPLEVGSTPPELTQLIKSLLERDKEKRAGAPEVQRLLEQIVAGTQASHRLGRRMLVATGALVGFALLLLWAPWKGAGKGAGDASGPGAGGERNGTGVASVVTPPAPGVPSILSGIPPGRMPVSDVLSLRCRLENVVDDSLLVRFDGREERAVVTDGELAVDVSPAEGAGSLEIVFPARDGAPELLLARVPYWVDRVAPRMTLDPLPGREATQGGRAVRFLSAPGESVTGVATDNQPEPPMLTVGGSAHPLAPGGKFAVAVFDEVAASEEQRTLRLAVTDEAGGVDARELVFYYDPNAPEISVRRAGAPSWTSGDAVLAVSAGSVELETRVVDAWLERAWLESDGAEEEFTSGDSLALELPAGSERVAYALVATDKAGNRTERVVTLELAVALERLAFDGEPVAAQGVFKTSTGRFTLEGSLNRSGKPVRLLLDGAALGGELGLDGPSFRREVALDRPGRYALRLEPLAAAWTIDYAEPLVPAGLTRVGEESIELAGRVHARTIQHPATSIRFVLVPPAETYDYGGTTIHVLEPYYVSRTETTWQQFRTIFPGDGRAKEPRSFSLGANAPEHPVVNVSFADAQAFCERIGGRLPTVAEWMHAAGGPDTPAYPWGDAWESRANAEADQTESCVTSEKASPSWCGMLGAGGNVSEWCQGPDAPAIRGGSYNKTPEECVVTKSHLVSGLGAKTDVGFRVVIPVGGAE